MVDHNDVVLNWEEWNDDIQAGLGDWEQATYLKHRALAKKLLSWSIIIFVAGLIGMAIAMYAILLGNKSRKKPV